MEQECPYCGYLEQYQGDPLEDYEETETECRKCHKEYLVRQHYDAWLSSEKQENSNGK